MNKKDILVLAAWAFFSVLAASSVDAEYHSYLASRRVYDVPVLWQLLGEGRSIASNISILQADLYFHGGVGHFYEEHEGGIAVAGRGAEEEHEHHAEEAALPVSTLNVLFRVSQAIGLAEHEHLHGAEVKEIIPWLYYAAKLDPNNVQAYTLTAFWLGDRLNKPDDAAAFLREGLKNNPGSWELNAEIGRIYCQYLGDYPAAERYLLRARDLLASAPHDKFQERYVLSWLADAYAEQGKSEETLDLYKRIKALFPGTTVYDEKIRMLGSAGAEGTGGMGQGAKKNEAEGMSN